MDQQSAASVQERERAPGMAQIKGEIRYRNPTAEQRKTAGCDWY